MGWCRKDKNLIIFTKYMGKFIEGVYILKYMGEMYIIYIYEGEDVVIFNANKGQRR
jgi:hypothetical protein